MRSPEEVAGPGGYHAPQTAPEGPASGPPPDGARGAVLGRAELVRRHPGLATIDWDGLNKRFPIRVPRTWAASGEPELLVQALPDPRELEIDAHDTPDPVGEQARSPLPWVVRKHDDRVLLLLTKRCQLYCRYCFRADHRPGEGEDPTPSEWAAMIAYARTSGAREVILSGGDPLAIRDDRLFEAMDAVREGLAAPPVIRIHTRAPITAPTRVTAALIAGIRARAPTWVFVHCNHAAELTPAVRAALAALVDSGIPVCNQAVLLAGVNDSPDTLATLSEELVALRVFPYYLHHPDAVPGNAHFRVSLEAGRAIYAALTQRVSGLALPRYVIDPPDGSGKRDVG